MGSSATWTAGGDGSVHSAPKARLPEGCVIDDGARLFVVSEGRGAELLYLFACMGFVCEETP